MVDRRGASSDGGRLPRSGFRRPRANLQASPEQLLEWRRFHFGNHGRGLGGRIEELGLRPAWTPGSGALAEPETAQPQEHPLAVLVDCAKRECDKAWLRWLSDVEPLAHGLREILEREGPVGSAAGREVRLGYELGELATQFLEVSALAQRLSRRSSGQVNKADDTKRWGRVEETLAVLEEALKKPRKAECRVVFDRVLGPAFDVDDGTTSELGRSVRTSVAEDPCAAAAGLFDHDAQRMAVLLAAHRCARLEFEGAYQPEIHDVALVGFDWRLFHEQELSLLTPTIAVVSADTAATSGLASLSRLLLSGRPVQVAVLVDPLERPGASGGADDRGLRSEIGYLGLGHRGAFVHQGNGADGHQLRAVFESAVATRGSVLHVLTSDGGALAAAGAAQGAETDGSSTVGWAAVASRAHPGFVYDPRRGGDWAARFSLHGNPQVENDWPTAEIVVVDDTSETLVDSKTLKVAFTFADYALLRRQFASDFLLLGDELTSDALVPLAEWLTLPVDTAPRYLPFIWAADERADLHRLVVRRRLALHVGDRLDYWHTLQQLGGVHDPYAESVRAQDRSLLEVRIVEERERLAAEHMASLEQQRQVVAREVVQRLMQGLTAKG